MRRGEVERLTEGKERLETQQTAVRTRNRNGTEEENRLYHVIRSYSLDLLFYLETIPECA